MVCEQLEIATVLSSTSAVLAQQGAASPGRFRALLAEYQTAGRGRRGRRWLSPFGSGLCLSLSWSFSDVPKDFPALSLAAGLAVRRALATTGSQGLSLKWPNDVLVNGAKLAGILVDVDGDARGPLRVIVGTGVNFSVPSSLVREVVADGGMAPGGCNDAQPRDVRVGRNALAARLIGCLYQVLHEFAAQGFSRLADEWRAHDYLRGREVTVTGGARVVAGVARGIGPDGSLLVEGADGVASVLTGDVTLRTGI
jgi:BirA family biotin operon repressor/biotin-[acetyl-CoA-carboxylase] ligase